MKSHLPLEKVAGVGLRAEVPSKDVVGAWEKIPVVYVEAETAQVGSN